MKQITGSLSCGDVRDNRGIVIFSSVMRFLQQYRLLVICVELALVVSFETILALGFINPVMGDILQGLVFAFLLLFPATMSGRRATMSRPTKLNAASFLNRDVVSLEDAETFAVLKGQVVLVTGAAGSIGSELCRQLMNYDIKRLIALDNNETGLFDLAQSLSSYKRAACFWPRIGDITDAKSMERFFAVERPQMIFHAAAYKHVPLLEQHPEQAIRTNTLATYRLCRLAQAFKVDRFVFVSTDKAAEPTSMLGASKRIGEMIVQSLAKAAGDETRFCAVRFGNVIGSRGSVVPVFAQQIQEGGPVTVTDPDATRYFMTIPEACGLVILTATIADQGGLYLLDMGEPVRIVDIAIKMISAHGLRLDRDISIVYTGLRPGEKLHETLVAANEELNVTSHHKIFSIVADSNVLTVPTISQLCHTLEDSLQYESGSQLRERLFEFVRLQELMIAN